MKRLAAGRLEQAGGRTRTARRRRPSPPALRHVLLLAAKDLRSETRAKEVAPPMVLFALVLVFFFTFHLPPGAARTPVPEPRAGAVAARDIAAASLWAAVLFAAVLGFGRTASAEREEARIEGLLLAPVDPAALFAGKALANFAYLTVMEAVVLVAAVPFFDVPPRLLPGLLVVALCANVGLAAAGTLFGAASQYARARELVLPFLLFPVILPLVLAATRLTSSLLTTGDFSGEARWFVLTAVFGVALSAVGAASFEYVVNE
jgi:heme exporter protein B